MEKMNLIKELEFPNGKVRVYSPELTEEERARRIENFHKACEHFAKYLERERMKKEDEKTG